MTALQLMEKAANKYKILKSKEIWETTSPEEEKLLALESRFVELKKKLSGNNRHMDDDEKQKPSKKGFRNKARSKRKIKSPAGSSKSHPKQT